MERNELIELKGIVKRFDDETILKSLDLSIKDGEFVTLLGPSGCGKTTTLRIIAGFETPDEGEVLFAGKNINKVPPNKRNINTVFQRYALFPHLNVKDNIAFGLKLRKMPQSEIDRKVEEMLELVNLKGFGNRSTTSLSGGQQQRVAIARAVVTKPSLLLADEPTGNLDSRNGLEVMELLSQLNQQGVTIVMVTHSQHDATFAQRTVELFDGQVVDSLDGVF